VPHADLLARIIADENRVAVVVFEVDPELHDDVRNIGWDGQSVVFAMPDDIRKRFARGLGRRGDVAAERWLTTRREGRIFLFNGRGTACLNFKAGEGYSVEPGTSDREILN